MKFSVFTPPASGSGKVPVSCLVTLLTCLTICALIVGRQLQVLYFLSGLTCDDQTFIVKSNAQRKAAEHGIALVVCDTSPRGLNIDGEDDDWDFGTGAGFYLNASISCLQPFVAKRVVASMTTVSFLLSQATQPKWKQYRMYDYVVKELPQAIQSLPGIDVSKVSSLID